MKKCFSVIMIAMSFLVVGVTYAGPVGSAADPAVLSNGVIWSGGKVGFVLGEENDFVSDRNIKGQSDTKLSFHGIKLGVLIQDIALIYALAGLGDIEAQNIKTDSSFYWGAGCTFTAFQHKITDEDWFRIGLDVKYRGISTDVNNITVNIEDEVIQFPTNSSSWDYHEWQLAFVTSFQLYAFIPYAGVKYSDIAGDASIKIFGFDHSFDNEADNNIGYFGGISFDIKQMGTFTIETRFSDEQAITLGGMIRF